MSENKRIVSNYEIPPVFGGNTPENMKAWEDKTKEINQSQPWLDDETARMEAKKRLFGE